MTRKHDKLEEILRKMEDERPDSDISISQGDLINLAISISVSSGKLLDFVSKKNIIESKILAAQLKKNLELFLNKSTESNLKDFDSDCKIETIPNKNIPKNKGMSQEKEKEFLERQTFRKIIVNRELENGGMAPIKEWKSITELNLKSSEKDKLIKEMRKLSLQGKTVEKTNLNYKLLVSIYDFTESFKYLENIQDYNGSFLITILKSSVEIDNKSSEFKVDLTKEKELCSNSEMLIISIYDINGLISEGEEKKFLLFLTFDKINGVLKYGNQKTIFINNKIHHLSNKQKSELQKFYTAKKINQ